MCDVCNNRHQDCPACSTPTDRSEAVKDTEKYRVSHCSDCPFSVYHNGQNSEQYDCKLLDDKRVIIAYHSDELDADEMPLPDECPLRSKNVTVTL